MATKNEPLTHQTAYDKVCAHLAQQKGRAVDTQGGCVYRAPGGRMCAVGCLIPNDEYQPGFDAELLPNIQRVCPSLQDLSRLFLSKIQAIHDRDTMGWGDSREALRCAEDVRQELVAFACAFEVTPGAEQAITVWGDDQ